MFLSGDVDGNKYLHCLGTEKKEISNHCGPSCSKHDYLNQIEFVFIMCKCPCLLW